jgi:hypothetical protein
MGEVSVCALFQYSAIPLFVGRGGGRAMGYAPEVGWWPGCC